MCKHVSSCLSNCICTHMSVILRVYFICVVWIISVYGHVHIVYVWVCMSLYLYVNMCKYVYMNVCECEILYIYINVGVCFHRCVNVLMCI